MICMPDNIAGVKRCKMSYTLLLLYIVNFNLASSGSSYVQCGMECLGAMSWDTKGVDFSQLDNIILYTCIIIIMKTLLL